jgi:tetratricopeptide (TPR) repeat protein
MLSSFYRHFGVVIVCFLVVSASRAAVNPAVAELFRRAALAENAGKLEEFRALCIQALDQARNLGDIEGEGAALFGIGNSYVWSGDYNQAAQAYKQASEVAERLGDKPRLLIVLQNLAECYFRAGNSYVNANDYRQAIQAYGQAREVAERLGDKPMEKEAIKAIEHLQRARKAIEPTQ